jgi:hypothetical protein
MSFATLPDSVAMRRQSRLRTGHELRNLPDSVAMRRQSRLRTGHELRNLPDSVAMRRQSRLRAGTDIAPASTVKLTNKQDRRVRLFRHLS